MKNLVGYVAGFAFTLGMIIGHEGKAGTQGDHFTANLMIAAFWPVTLPLLIGGEVGKALR